MRGRLLAACFLVAASASPALAGPPQVRITIGGYGQGYGYGPQPTPVASSAPAASIPPVAAAVIGAEVAIAQASAYQRYLQYVAAAQGGRVDPSQYFTNGAAALTLPSTGTASSYFTNGAEATRVPGPLPTTAPSAAPPPPPPPPPPPAAIGAQPPPPPPPAPTAAAAPLPPYWWVEGQTPPDDVAEPTPEPPPVAPPAAADDAPPTVAMSFEEWLRTMDTGAAAATPATAGAADEAPLEVAEPASAALELQPRVFPRGHDPGWRKKGVSTARVAVDGPGALAVPLAVTFLAGLLVGAVSVRRLRSKPA